MRKCCSGPWWRAPIAPSRDRLTMIDPARSRPELTALTSLRGIAAIAVVLQHFAATAQSNASGWIPSPVPHGYMAVDFFFVLSGFIMSYTYLAGFETLGWRAMDRFCGSGWHASFRSGSRSRQSFSLCGGDRVALRAGVAVLDRQGRRARRDDRRQPACICRVFCRTTI